MNQHPYRLVVLISGNGSNLQAIISQCALGKIEASVVGVISSNTEAYGLQRAADAGIPTATVTPSDFASREAYDAQLAQLIESWQADAVILAGYMRILTPAFVRQYRGRMLNIHPSLLPHYTGLNTHQRVLDAGETEHGASVHFVTEELDDGPVVLQGNVPIFDLDTAETLQDRVHDQEHRIYPMAINWLATGRLRLKENHAYLDDKRLAGSGYAPD